MKPKPKPAMTLAEQLRERVDHYRRQAALELAKAKRAKREGRAKAADAHMRASILYGDKSDDFLLQLARTAPDEPEGEVRPEPLVFDGTDQVKAMQTYRALMASGVGQTYFWVRDDFEKAVFGLARAAIDAGWNVERAKAVIDLFVEREMPRIDEGAAQALLETEIELRPWRAPHVSEETCATEPEPASQDPVTITASQPVPELMPLETVAREAPYEELTRMALPQRRSRQDRIAAAVMALSRVRT